MCNANTLIALTSDLWNPLFSGVSVVKYNTPYNPPAPTVTSISLASGTAEGKTPVIIIGTNFNFDATVTTGGNFAWSVRVTETEIDAFTPAGTGTQDVEVTNTDGQV